AGPLIERVQLSQQKVRDGMSGSGRGARPEYVVARPAEFVHNVDSIARDLATELEAVAAPHPAHPIIPLKTVTPELRFQVVADVEEPHGLDLRDGWEGRIDGQAHTQVLHAGCAIRGSPARVDAVVAELKIVQHRGAESPGPG